MSCRTDLSKARHHLFDLYSDLLELEVRVASPVAAIRIGRARDMLLKAHDELGNALKMCVDPLEEGERPWMRLELMPIGDRRNIVVQVRGEAGAAALAYWTGQMWAHAPISTQVSPIDFEPLEFRFPLADAERTS